jgi:hypothetical protein
MLVGLTTAILYLLEHVPLYITLIAVCNVRVVLMLIRMLFMAIVTYLIISAVAILCAPIKGAMWKIVDRVRGWFKRS